MPDDPNSEEGASPADDIAKQNPGQTTTDDLAKGKDDVSDNDMTGTEIE